MTEIVVGMQVVVRPDEGEELMGTVITTECPVFGEAYPDIPAMHILIEGDAPGKEICYPAEWVIPYIDIYEGRA